jgi:hypothetical protein
MLMDQIIDVQKQTGQSDNQRSTKIILIFIIVIFIIATLIYFNILPFYPSKKNSPSSINNPKTETFKYDTTKAKTLLAQYIKETIKPNLLPSNFETNKRINPFQQKKTPNVFAYFFAAENASISAFFRYEENSNVINSFSISIDSKNIPSSTAPEDLANSFFSPYLINPYVFSNSNCKQATGSVLCENFQTASDGKRGYAMTMFGKPPRWIVVLSACFIPKESNSFAKAKSCVVF